MTAFTRAAWPRWCRGAMVLATIVAPQASAQRPVTLVAEAFAAGVEVLAHAGAGLRVGTTVTVGPSETVNIGTTFTRDYRTVLNGYVSLGIPLGRGVEAILSPIGVAVTTGDDFAAAYPSAQAMLGVPVGRLRLGSGVRVVRIAGANGSGDYWVQWVPFRIGLPLGR